MQMDDIEVSVIKNQTSGNVFQVAVQTNYKNRVYVVSFMKYPEVREMDWGGSYEYATAVFAGTEAGEIENYSPFIRSYDNNPTESMAIQYVKQLLREFIESDNE
jgi:hypothetical protein